VNRCPGCGQSGRAVSETTVGSLLRPAALAQRQERAHRFCPTPACPVVYFGARDIMRQDDLRVPVFSKEPRGKRIVCYCFEIREQEIEAPERDGGSASFLRVRRLVREGRCACEVRNPHGSCCLNEILQVERANARREESDSDAAGTFLSEKTWG